MANIPRYATSPDLANTGLAKNPTSTESSNTGFYRPAISLKPNDDDKQGDLFAQMGATEIRFNGSDYVPAVDDERLTGQILRVFNLMRDEKWRTLAEIEQLTGDPQASISAQLRHMRKPRFGLHTINKRSRGDRASGLFEYQLVVHKG